MKLGVLGGTFDPVHLGHIRMAEEAAKELGLDEVIFVPAGVPLTRYPGRTTPARHRLRMLRLALAGRPGLVISTFEIDRSVPSYTFETLSELRDRDGNIEELYFILGWDSLEQLPDWRKPELIIELARLAAAPRPGRRCPDISKLEGVLPGISERVIFLNEPHVDISASEIRRRVAAGEPVDDWVPSPVADYIKKNGLYIKTPEV